MKFMYAFLFLALVLYGCKEANENSANSDATVDMSADELFKKNSETVMANLKGWQDENLDYSMYANDFVLLDTGFGVEEDSINLNDMREYDKTLWKNYDFKLLTDPPVLLPGVNPDTKKPDGSIRHYSDWEVTKVATDSTPAKSGVLSMYESFDFNADGKITYQQAYADFTGLMTYLHSTDDE